MLPSGSAFASIDLLPLSCDARGDGFALELTGDSGVALSVEVRAGASILCRGLAVGVTFVEVVSDFKPAFFAATALASLSCSRSLVLFRVAESDREGTVAI